MTLLSADVLANLDLPSYIGQRSVSFKFVLVNSVLPIPPIEIHPLRDTTLSLSHDTTRTIKRQVQGLTLSTAESNLINSISSRILISMIVGDTEFPLGRYMFADASELLFTNGTIFNAIMYDEMFMIDQQIENGFSPGLSPPALSTGGGVNCERVIRSLLVNISVALDIEPTPYVTIGSWPAGTTRGQIIEQIGLDGDWFSPWFGNDGEMHFIRTFEPAMKIPTFDLDAGSRVVRDTIVKSNDLISSPNRFIVISNGISDDGQAVSPLVGRADISPSAPHSIINRGFVIPSVTERQVSSQAQISAIARNLAIRQVVFERVELATAPDPRHDSYDVILWQGEKWLELAWTLPLIEGAAMGHSMRKAYV